MNNEFPPVCDHLAPVLSRELSAGNKVDEVSTNAFERCRLLVILRFGYQERHEWVASTADLDEGIQRDSHYSVGRSLSCRAHRHALLAPVGFRMA
ncbi:MAG: hypothetical protein WBX15_08925 [Thermoanaerobaculia bacterium]